jgi:MYXO-CTERM domain-containing protein
MRQVVNRILAIGIATAAAAASSSSLAQLTYNSAPTTGHDQDIVIESGLADGAVGANGEFGSRQFYQEGLSTQIPAHKKGLLQSNTGFVSPTTTNTINFDFAPFTGNNILKFDATHLDAKSLTLTTPAAFTNLAFVFSGGSLNSGANQYQGVLTYTINYAGGATQVGTIKTPDWGVTPAAIEGTENFLLSGRINAGAAGATPWPLTPDPETTAGRWRLLVKEVATTSTANRLSVNFSNPQQHLNATPEVLDPLATATPTGGTPAITGADVVVFGLAGASGGGGGGFNIADFDHLNGVTGADLGILTTNFGATPPLTNAQGDTDADTDVDGNDFLKWQTNLGATSAVANATAAPEPASAALALMGLLAASCRRRRRN